MTHSFFGGVYPATRKDMTRRKPLSRLSRTPKEIVIPLIMCADGPSTPMVRPGGRRFSGTDNFLACFNSGNAVLDIVYLAVQHDFLCG